MMMALIDAANTKAATLTHKQHQSQHHHHNNHKVLPQQQRLARRGRLGHQS
jgi:hypothetical protein